MPQDAERRDLTVNALFYNLNTRTVEDFTGRGLSDLRDGVLRTPLPPLETFREGETVLVLGLPRVVLLRFPASAAPNMAPYIASAIMVEARL